MDQNPEKAMGGTRTGIPTLAIGGRYAIWTEAGREGERLPLDAAAGKIVNGAVPLVCYAPAISRRLGIRRFTSFDVLELFAFVYPATFCVPTLTGLADKLNLPKPLRLDDHADGLFQTVDALLADLQDLSTDRNDSAKAVARAMLTGDWPWAVAVADALGISVEEGERVGAVAGLDVWRGLGEWAERAPRPASGNDDVEPGEASSRLRDILGAQSESRPQQARYAEEITTAFRPRRSETAPETVLAEAGTGVGKTLGYIAPASLWAEKNQGAVWISTYTRNLQHQIDQELSRLYADPVEKRRKVVLRKGRENYLCLLNYEEAAAGARVRRDEVAALGLIARWINATGDGALVAGDFPGWLKDIVGSRRYEAMTDHRGECIYTACSHYHRCFIEHSVRRSRRAHIVVANHALVMIQAALGGAGDADPNLPTRYIFDEGHHVFSAADSAFSSHLSAVETGELRRWFRGNETARNNRSARIKGLRARIGDIIASDEAAEALLDQIVRAAGVLPGPGWSQRLAGSAPQGPIEALLSLIRNQVYSRVKHRDSAYGLETEVRPLADGIIEAASEVDRAFANLLNPLGDLKKWFVEQLEDQADELDTNSRNRIEAVVRSLELRAVMPLTAWREMVRTLPQDITAGFVDWFAVDRQFGKDADIGMHRHWIDPGEPFAATIGQRAHGLAITSATLRDNSTDDEAGWANALVRTGARHLETNVAQVSVESPFDYVENTRVLVVRDVTANSADQVAAAFRELFTASGGGGLGIFTAINRLRQVHDKLAPAMEERNLPLFGQHVDGYDVSTLIDMFRGDRDSCLLGTDAIRDGVDVPGDALRMIVFDRVPWPRPDILHKARRAAYGGAAYDDMLTRLRLKQAFGRLVRQSADRGIFVMLDARLPTRLCTAFPDGVEVERLGLAEAIDRVRHFFETA